MPCAGLNNPSYLRFLRECEGLNSLSGSLGYCASLIATITSPIRYPGDLFYPLIQMGWMNGPAN